MKLAILLLSISYLITAADLAEARGTAGEKAVCESRFIVDMPNAGVLDKYSFSAYSQAFPDGGVLLQFDAAPFTNFNMGVSFSGSNIIGAGEPTWQNLPGVHLRARIIDEKLYFPAIVLGFYSQGRGVFDEGKDRFLTQSPGFFLAASKNYQWALGVVSYHFGANYSIEPKPEKRSPNVYLGLEHSVGSYVSLNVEYNATFDDGDAEFREKKGLLNASLRWSLAKGFTIEIQARDLLEHSAVYSGFNRFVCLEYIATF